ncbi:hypothetical protein LOCC1_G004561 [Lachnellula occidentalis]|uniref:Uncharacterized protein n=1 Tax=Lachnellula occidentalis TaxID=215460 RepID=A0A8H8UD64_9HELO|nr:hypothetical protein LOCC1_G004561 [Lachnellula occidentalis]
MLFPVSNRPRTSRVLMSLSAVLFLFICFVGRRHMHELPIEVIEQHVVKQYGGAYRIPKGALPSVNLVVAATSNEDYSWAKRDLKVPGMVVIPYIADNTSAPYHPQLNKGHEAMMYHQYFYDFYDKLPDISILVHSQSHSWHVDQLLDQSMIFSLNHLDLREVQQRQFLNLRVTWGFGCMAGAINTTRANEESGILPEQGVMQEAFRANFNLYDIPEILATPCCSQIAVTKERILSVPREQYKHHIDWLLHTPLEDAISGRTWEHMWQYLFLQKAIDCPLEHKAYCRLYHICFGGREQYDEYIELQQGAHKLDEELLKLKNVEDNWEVHRKEREEAAKKNGEKKDEVKGAIEMEKKANTKMQMKLQRELDSIREAIRVRKEIAKVRGAVEVNRVAEGEDLYGDELEPSAEKAFVKEEDKTKVNKATII